MIYILAGHHSKDSGAVTTHPRLGIIKEADLTKELRDLVIRSLIDIEKIKDVKKDDDNKTLNEIIYGLREISNKDLVVDIHFNAFNGKATGTEVIVPKIHSSIENALAAELSESIASIMNIKNRGVKLENNTPRGRLGIFKGPGNRILVEVCFMDNDKEYETYIINKYIIAAMIAQVINDRYVKKILELD